MITKEVLIVNPTGLHCRPGNLFVKEAKTYNAAIHVIKGEKRVNAKSLLTLLKAGISKGDTIAIEADGPDEEVAIESLAGFIANLTE